MTRGLPLRRHVLRTALVGFTLIFSSLALIGAAGAHGAGSNQLLVSASDGACDVSGRIRAGLVNVRFENASAAARRLEIFRVKPEVTSRQFTAALRGDRERALSDLLSGTDQALGVPDALDPMLATETITPLSTGRYAVACVPATAAGEPAPSTPQVTFFDVRGRVSSYAYLPRVDGWVQITDAAATILSGGVPRVGFVKITNNGTRPHGFTLTRLRGNATAQDAYQYFVSSFSGASATTGASPAFLVGGVGHVSPGASVYLELDLEPGRYAYFSTDGEDAPGGVTTGLMGEFGVLR